MKREIRIKWTEEMVEATMMAADKIGLNATAYVRMAILERLARDGVHPEQVRAD